MAKVSVSADTSHTPAEVWALAIDLTKVADWNSMHETFIGDYPETLTEGATYKQRVKLMGTPAEMSWQVVALEEPTRIEQNADGPMGVKAVQLITIEPTPAGSKVTIVNEFNGPALKGPMAMMVEKQAGGAAKKSIASFTDLLG